MSLPKDAIELRTDAGTLVFQIFRRYPNEGVTEFQVSCELEAKFGGYLPERFRATFYQGDLARLAGYLEVHLEPARMKRENAGTTWNESKSFAEPFLTLGMEFTIGVDGGDPPATDDGELSITVMINCGSPGMDKPNCYFGFESCVLIEDLGKFCSAIRKLEGGENLGKTERQTT